MYVSYFSIKLEGEEKNQYENTLILSESPLGEGLSVCAVAVTPRFLRI